MRLAAISLVLAFAAKLYEDTSAETTVGDFGWDKASTSIEMNINFV